MSNKFNTNALTEYARSYARRIAGDFYHNHPVISGKQILNVTPIGQVNLFVISSLSDKWRADAQKFRSPYFDFANPEVEEALRTFMNVVSQHISVRREHFEPLLVEAVKKTLTLLFDPRAYFDEVLRDQPDFQLTADAARQLSRYTQIHKVIPTMLEQRMNGKPFIYVNQALSYLDEALTQRGHELDRYDKYVALFSEKVPMDLSALFRNHVPDALPGQGSRSFFDAELGEPEAPRPPAAPQPDDAPAPAETPVVTEAVQREEFVPVVSEAKPGDGAGTGGALFVGGDERQSAPVAPIAQPTVMPASALSSPTDVATATVSTADTPPPTDEPLTLNDRLRTETKAAPATPETGPTSVGEAFYRAPIESITKSISLNQKFRFINQLFNGNTGAYNQAIEELDKVNNYGQALDLISYRYASQYLWDMSSDEVSELVEILKRRFA